jgi:PAS domain S-box-containing protein
MIERSAPVGSRVLVADDEPRVLDTFTRNLTRSGYTVLTAKDGEQALQTYERELPDIVVLDVRMPSLDGFDVLRSIRERDPEAEVILITGHGDMDTAISALRAGASDFVPKPVQQDVLEATLRRAQERLQLRASLRQAQEALRASEEHYRAIAETALVGVGIVDSREDISFANQSLADMLGYSHERLAGMNLSEITSPEEFAVFLEQTEIRRAGRRSQYESLLRGKDGREVNVLISAAPLWNEDGSFWGTLAVVSDITERKQAERSLTWQSEVNAAIAELSQTLISASA